MTQTEPEVFRAFAERHGFAVAAPGTVLPMRGQLEGVPRAFWILFAGTFVNRVAIARGRPLSVSASRG